MRHCRIDCALDFTCDMVALCFVALLKAARFGFGFGFDAVLIHCFLPAAGCGVGQTIGGAC